MLVLGAVCPKSLQHGLKYMAFGCATVKCQQVKLERARYGWLELKRA
jgi:hypothetical protein